ncbi:hypothetical protein KP77_01840 [Jeotgalibacillus alimentarius]|uniref:Uncharacterized protein n=1 Tax=Jeotgalibacillus alimentarius TaxID=135826 RepID=A0A0C2SI22_9BACL|nr:hypothetical protein [Jeotgalibacillus alimentarius]KIL53584.1 hypothetical protein KP77_01840 [Jeotgalibacillus alimentarius]
MGLRAWLRLAWAEGKESQVDGMTEELKELRSWLKEITGTGSRLME